jgi:hypothetical protein
MLYITPEKVIAKILRSYNSTHYYKDFTYYLRIGYYGESKNNLYIDYSSTRRVYKDNKNLTPKSIQIESLYSNKKLRIHFSYEFPYRNSYLNYNLFFSLIILQYYLDKSTRGSIYLFWNIDNNIRQTGSYIKARVDFKYIFKVPEHGYMLNIPRGIAI